MYLGRALREVAKGTRLSRAQAVKTFFFYLSIDRHEVEIHQMTGHVVECPIDEMNRPWRSLPTRLDAAGNPVAAPAVPIVTAA